MEAAGQKTSLRSHRTISNWVIFFSVLFLAFIFARLLPFSTLKYDNWAFTEWLVNYQGGFVRRGLLGELLRRAYYNQILATNVLIAALNIGLLVMGLLHYRRIDDPKLKTAFVFLFFVGSFGMLSHFLQDVYYYRKENFGFLILLIIFLLKPKDHVYMSRASTALSILLIILALLNHEPFLLGHGIFLYLFLYNHIEKKSDRILGTAIILGVFICMFVFHGSKETEEGIWASIRQQDKAAVSGRHAIGAIGWSMREGISLVTYTIRTHPISIFNWMMAAVLLLLQLYLVFRYLGKPMKYLVLFLALNLCILLVFVLGADWGRWLNMIWFNLIIVLINFKDYEAGVMNTEKIFGNKLNALTWNTPPAKISFSWFAAIFLLLALLKTPEFGFYSMGEMFDFFRELFG